MNWGLDDNITVELRDKTGKTILDSKKVMVEKRQRWGTTQTGARAAYLTTERTFCFDGKPDGDYQLAFIVSKTGVLQPAMEFPTKYAHNTHKACDSIYMVEPDCP